MEIDKIKSLSLALNEVRKAHRLIFSYQERMLSLVKFIRNKLDFNDLYGVKHFSNPLSQSRGRIKLFDGIWVWDFLYTYVFEYYIGSIVMDDDSEISLSIIQYTDTGFFDSECEDRNDIKKFSPTEEAMSKLLFFLEDKPVKCKTLWDSIDYTEQFVLDKKYACRSHKETVLYPKGENKNKLLLYSIPIEKFVDEDCALESLKDYLEFLKRNDIELDLV